MKHRRLYYISLGVLLTVFLYFSYQIYIRTRQSLTVVFLDVGQGDSILISKGTTQILIDGGPSGKTELAKIGKYLPFSDREIELIIATHPDKDHIGGLVEVARNYKIGKVLATAAEKDTAIFREWKEVINYNKIETLEVARGDKINFGNAELKVLNPPARINPKVGEANSGSVVTRLDFGENSFLFTGDIESEAESKLAEVAEDLDIDYLKVAHHGSKHSTSSEFLKAATPKEAIISAGKNNSYGHPHSETLARLEEQEVKVRRTDETGDIIYKCFKSKDQCSIVE